MEIQDEGFIDLTLVTQDGERVTQTVDLFGLYVDVQDALRKALGNDSDDRLYAESLQDSLTRRGFPAVSQMAAIRLAEAVRERFQELKKKGTGSNTPESPGSTGSTPGS